MGMVSVMVISSLSQMMSGMTLSMMPPIFPDPGAGSAPRTFYQQTHGYEISTRDPTSMDLGDIIGEVKALDEAVGRSIYAQSRMVEFSGIMTRVYTASLKGRSALAVEISKAKQSAVKAARYYRPASDYIAKLDRVSRLANDPSRVRQEVRGILDEIAAQVAFFASFRNAVPGRVEQLAPYEQRKVRGMIEAQRRWRG